MKSRLVLLACCLALLSSCGQGDKGTGKAPEFAVIEAKTTTANLTNSYPATIKGKQDVEIRPMVSGFITKFARGRRRNSTQRTSVVQHRPRTVSGSRKFGQSCC